MKVAVAKASRDKVKIEKGMYVNCKISRVLWVVSLVIAVLICGIGLFAFFKNTPQCTCGVVPCIFCLITNPGAAQAVITSIGIASGGITLFAGARRQRAKGFLVADIFDEMFPYYWVSILVQATCLFFGVFACGSENRFAIFLFLTATLICLGQIIYAMWGVLWSDSHWNKLTIDYLESIATKLGEEEERLSAPRRLQYTCLLANYIGHKFLMQDWLVSSTQGKKISETLFSDDGDVVKLFDLVLKDGSQHGTGADNTPNDTAVLQLWLRDIDTPLTRKADWISIVARLAKMWQHILSQMTSLQDQSRIIFEVLRMGVGRKIQSYLSYGLVFYLAQETISSDSLVTKKDIIHPRITLLASVNQHIQDQKKSNDSTADNLDSAYWDLCFTLLCLEIFAQIEGADNATQYEGWLDFIAKTNLDSYHKFKDENDTQKIELQMALGVAILQGMREVIPSRMIWTLPHAIKYVQGTIWGHEYKI